MRTFTVMSPTGCPYQLRQWRFQMTEWIKCADKMPPDDTDLWAWHAAYQVPKLATYYADDGTFVEFGTGEDIGASHWMPIIPPTPPQD